MPVFGQKSKAILETVDDLLVEVLYRVIPYRDITVLSGARLKAAQNELFRKGLSKKQWPNSKHNIDANGIFLDKPESTGKCIAVDWAIYPIRWNDLNDFTHTAGRIQQAADELDIKIRWGGNWDMDDDVINDQSFQDLGHIELVLR